MKKQFKAESKKLMDLMINSIYTNKEIFLRELISNASDAIDKLHYQSLTDKSIKVDKKKFKILISVDEDKRTITISDNGIGMSKEELENNLGVIASSGSEKFKNENEHKKDIDVIGQFGVGFYSSFMVASEIKVVSKKYGTDEANSWVSTGIDGYQISKDNKDSYGTDIILTIKEGDDYEYNELLHNHTIKRLIKKYSNYITYPIAIIEDGKEEIINDQIPLWRRDKKKITDEEYNTFYSDKFFDYDKPLAHIHNYAEGLVSFHSLLFIPKKAPFDYYTKEYERGLQLYSNGVLIMEKCKDIIPEYFSFVKGIIDSPDLNLNISREMLQQDRTLTTIAKNIEGKISNELKTIMNDSRDEYIKFFEAFGSTLKFGVYNNFGINKEKLQDLLIFNDDEHKYISLNEYVNNMIEGQDKIYYICGETLEKLDDAPVLESYKDKGYKVLFCTDYMDEFVLKTIGKYKDYEFVNISTDKNEEIDEETKKLNEENKELFKFMSDNLSDISEVRFTSKLKTHPVCLSTKGDISIEMEKVINAMPTDEHINAEKVLEINESHPIANRIKELYKSDKDELAKISKILYAQARLIEGLSIDNPTEITNLICDELGK